MSFEGYYQVKCENGHYYTESVYCDSPNCEECGASVIKNMVDETNGTSDGYDENFSDGCNYKIEIWKNDLESINSENKTLKQFLDRFQEEYYLNSSPMGLLKLYNDIVQYEMSKGAE